jgi:hypothetical protein
MKLVLDDSVPRELVAEMRAAGDLPLAPGDELVLAAERFAVDTPDAEWLAAVAGPGVAVLLLDGRSKRAAYLLTMCLAGPGSTVPDSMGRPASIHPRMPPSRSPTRRWPIERSIHHIRAATDPVESS